jgi:hypothetical protein
MKLKANITIVIIVLLFLMTVQTASAQDIVAGVKPGDEFTYSVTGSYSSSAPLSDVPAEVLNAAASVFFKVTIVNVSNPTVGYLWLWHFTNGTEQTGDGNVNLEIPSESVGPFWPIVSANISLGQSIHPHFGPPTYFNETIMWPYSNYTRETNRLETQSIEQNNQTAVTKYRNVHSDVYFDKLTGMLVQLNEEVQYQSPDFTTTLTWKLLGQTVWTFSSVGSYPPAPFFSLPVIIAVVVIISLLVFIAGWFVSNKLKASKRKKLLGKK